MTRSLHIRKVAVLGAGVMGAQIAAHLVNAGVDTLLFELAAEGKNPNAHVEKAIKSLSKLKPSPLATQDVAKKIIAANYEQHLPLLNECDLVIEVIAERMDLKKPLYEKIAPHLAEHCILASNTSGLSINELANTLSQSQSERFCGVHFFNPPRYMHLAELIPAKSTKTEILAQLETFLVSTLGKGVVYARDTANFIGNRIGVFSMLSTIHQAEQFGLAFDLVDKLTGPMIGRPKSATYRTADVVGLDTLNHVVSTMCDTLKDDPWKAYFKTPDWLKNLVSKGALGQKTRVGIYRKKGKDIHVLNAETGQYEAQNAIIDDSVKIILKEKNQLEKFRQLRECDHPQAQFLWSIFRDLFHYCAYHLSDIANCARDIDLAIRWGYGWEMGPFETWQAADWLEIAQWIQEDIDANKSMSTASLPDWVKSLTSGVHTADGSFNPERKEFQARSSLGVYSRQIFPQLVLGEQFNSPSVTEFETDDVRCWHQNDGILLLSYKTKRNTINAGVLSGIHQAIKTAEDKYKGLIIWQTDEPFSFGADLSDAVSTLKSGNVDGFTQSVKRFQDTSMAIKYANVPVVVAIRGLALGGGCEFTMHAARAVAALESYIGLVEVGVGLLPAGGGLKELALRASKSAINGDVFTQIQDYFQSVAKGSVSTSAAHAKQMGFLGEKDIIICHAQEVLHVAKTQVNSLHEQGYRAPIPERNILVAGSTGVASLKMMLVNMLEGHFISEHDYNIGCAIAEVICGGQLDRNSVVDEDWLLALERKYFVELAQTEKTQQRIAHLLKTGKPLRN